MWCENDHYVKSIPSSIQHFCTYGNTLVCNTCFTPNMKLPESPTACIFIQFWIVQLYNFPTTQKAKKQKLKDSDSTVPHFFVANTTPFLTMSLVLWKPLKVDVKPAFHPLLLYTRYPVGNGIIHNELQIMNDATEAQAGCQSPKSQINPLLFLTSCILYKCPSCNKCSGAREGQAGQDPRSRGTLRRSPSSCSKPASTSHLRLSSSHRSGLLWSSWTLVEWLDHLSRFSFQRNIFKLTCSTLPSYRLQCRVWPADR